jgi:hypothetical protein
MVGTNGQSESGMLQATGVSFTGSTGTLQFEYSASGQIMNCDFSYQLKVVGSNQSNVVINLSNFGRLCSVENTSSIVMNAKNNYWGDASGPYHPTLNPSGQGATISAKVDFSPYKTSPNSITDVEGIDLNIPTDFSLKQNYPNPFNPSTVIRYGLPKDVNVRLAVYNVLGQQIMNMVDEEQKAGYHEVVFQAGNLSSGVYFYSIAAGEFRQTKKLVMLK